MKRQTLLSLFALLAVLSSFRSVAQDGEPKVIKLVETPGKFETASLTLKPGSYQFEVTNENVDHPVAFFLQKISDKGNSDFATALPNSGLSSTISEGETAKTGVVELAEGNYVYSCPLNPTGYYQITVTK